MNDEQTIDTRIADALESSLREEMAWLRQILEDPDASNPAARLRQERLNAYEHVISLIDTLREWDWGF